MDEHQEQHVQEAEAAHSTAIIDHNATKMPDEKDSQALQVQENQLPFANH